jgi:hypothetical protein
MGLRLKFNVWMGTVLSIAIVISGVVIYSDLYQSARANAVKTASLLMAAAESTRDYTTTFIKPQLDRRLDIEFLPQSVPAFAATETIISLRKQFPEYSYKEATLNPTNLRDRASDWEADLINSFRTGWEQSQIVGERLQGQIPVLYVAKPIRIKTADCLTCHSTPSAAPASMIRLYGDVNGFGWMLDEIVGAKIVTVPLSSYDSEIMQAFIKLMGVLVLIALLAIGLGNLLIGKSAAGKTT